MERSSCPDHTLRKPLFPGNKYRLQFELIVEATLRSGELSANSDDAEEEWDLFGGESGQLGVIFRVLGSPHDEDLTHLDSVTTAMIKNMSPKNPMVRLLYI